MEQVKKGTLLGLALLLLMGSAACAGPTAGEINSLFNQACDSYEAGDIVSARDGFEALISMGVRSGAVYYNLGNCLYKQGEVGRAVASYRRALMLNPRDEDTRFNLDVVRSAVGTRDTTSAFGSGGLTGIPLSIASPRDWQIVFYVSYYLAVIFLLGVLFLSGRGRMLAGRMLLALVIVGIGSYALSANGWSRFKGGSDAVVVVERTEFMSGPGAAFEELAKLSDGVELTLRARSGIWVEARLPTGEVGWVREGDLEPI